MKKFELLTLLAAGFLGLIFLAATLPVTMVKAEGEGLTNTPLPSDTATPTNTPVPPTATNTATPTSTATPTAPPTATATGVPPTATNTSLPPTATNTPGATSSPPNPATPTATRPPVLPPTGEMPLPFMSATDWLVLIISLIVAGLGFGLFGYGMWVDYRLDYHKRKRNPEILFTGLVLMFVVCGILIFQLIRSLSAAPPGVTNYTPLGPVGNDASSVKAPGLVQPPSIHQTPTPNPGPAEIDSTDRSPIVRVVIPSLYIDSDVQAAPFVGDTWDVSTLGHSVAWLENTSLPGLGSNTVLAGHITVRNDGNGPFIYLSALAPGDVVLVYTQENVYTYQVRAQEIVEETDASVIASTGSSQLTLITCANWDRITKAYQARRAVFADLVSVVALAASGY